MKGRASAPAKVILLGEHFVVYGKPAIVVAIDRRAHATARLRSDKAIYIRSNDLGVSGYFFDGKFEAEEGGPEAEGKLRPVETVVRRLMNSAGTRAGVTLEITSTIPVEAGLGSSAAVAVASVAAVSSILGLDLSPDEMFNLAYDAERLIHGTPSGIDPAVSTYGGTLRYVKGKGITRLNVNVDLQLVIGNTGIPRSTGKLVGKVRELGNKHPTILNSILESSERMVEEAVKAMKSQDLETLGELMNIDQGLLSAVGVSHCMLERLIYAARDAGAYGAKLTGAGGGGCMVALAPQGRVEDIVKAITDAGGEAFTAKKTEEGVRFEG
ncbi:MAG: mevalonate kinase [Candidatus Bathyarchaeia archaeon]